MKKFLFIAVAAVAMLFTACKGKDAASIDPNSVDNVTNKCWEITYTLKGVSASSYVWGTERECVVALQTSAKLVTVGKYTYKATSITDADACYKKAAEAEDK